MNYLLHLIILFEIYLILALSLNLLVGYTGLLSLAHSAFYGLGAYSSTLLIMDFNLGFMTSLFLTVIIASLFSLLISFAAMKFEGDYFVLATLAFQIILFSLFNNWVNLTRGAYGIPDIPKPLIFNFRVDSSYKFAILGFVMTFIISAFLYLIFNSPFGRTLRAIRDNEKAVESFGKNPMSFKFRSIAAASCCAALAGAFYASYISFIDPTNFTVDESIVMLSMVVIGGTGNFRGSFLGVLILIFVPEILRLIAIPSTLAANINMVIYGVILIGIMRFRPRGLAGTYVYK